MTQSSVETVIGKLVSDEELRAAFRRNRNEAIRLMLAQGWTLNPVEIEAISALDPSDLDRLAAKLDPRVQKASLKKGVTRKRLGGWIIAIASLGLAGGRPAGAATLTLDEAVKAALEANREIHIATLQVDRDDDAITDAKAKRLPRMELQALGGQTLSDINVTVPGGSFGTYPGIGPIPSTDTTITSEPSRSAFVVASIEQPLTQLHAAGLNVRLNRQVRESDREELRARRAAVVSEVKNAYFDILRTRSALDAAGEQLALLQETKRVVSELLNRESVLKSEVMEVDTRIARQELQLLTLRHADESTKERLNDALGRDLATDFDVAPLAEAMLGEDDLAQARQHALAQRPEARQARLRVEEADTQRRLTKAEYIPDLSLAVTYFSYFGIDLLPRNVAQAGLQLKWQPLDWGRPKRLASANLRTEQAQSQVAAVESRIALEVGKTFRALGEAQAQLSVRRLARETAAERARVANDRVKEQASLLEDALAAQAALAEADSDYQQALAGAWAARADFEKSIGEEI